MEAVNCTDTLRVQNNTVVDGMFIGCLPITSLLLSTLECFYNQTCLDKIKQALNIQNFSIDPLNSLESSQYSSKTTVNQIMNNLMLENWTYEINYTDYFSQCNLTKCSYSVMDKKNPLSTFMTLLGLCKYILCF